MVGKVAGQYTNTNSIDQADANAHSVNNEDIADQKKILPMGIQTYLTYLGIEKIFLYVK